MAPKPKSRRKLYASSSSTCTETSLTVADAAVVTASSPVVSASAVNSCTVTTPMFSTTDPAHLRIKETRLSAKVQSCKNCDSMKRKKQTHNRKFNQLKAHCQKLEARLKELLHEDSSIQSEEELDGIDATNAVRYV